MMAWICIMCLAMLNVVNVVMIGNLAKEKRHDIDKLKFPIRVMEERNEKKED